MLDEPSNALVPVERPRMATLVQSDGAGFRVAERDLRLSDREEVRRQLPDIVGQALARAWVDPEFRAALIADALGTFAAAGIHLPPTMSIEFTVSGGERPKIVVYEQKEGSRFRMRIFYLQLIMIAGR